ncbi:MAG: molecular chaperone TorD family protein [Sulfurovaceae bacterium]|nr:molecular chaperone TorD family protein [Sulfurovaceae bacterium]
MDNKIRAYIFAFLSRIFSSHIEKKLLNEIQANEDLLKTIGENAYKYLKQNDEEKLLAELNVAFHSLFVTNNHPVESAVIDAKNEILVGLQNPVMQFYFNHGYDLNLAASSLHVPDHLAIEFGFMQNLVLQKDKLAQIKFYEEHLMVWVPPYLISTKEMSDNPFYKDICDFTIDFMFEDYSSLFEEVNDELSK